MAKATAATVMKAAEKARLADRRVAEAQRALDKAVRARDKADAQYFSLISEVLPGRLAATHEARQEPNPAPSA